MASPTKHRRHLPSLEKRLRSRQRKLALQGVPLSDPVGNRPATFLIDLEGIACSPEATEILAALRKRGHRVVLVSSQSEARAANAAKNLPFDHLLAGVTNGCKIIMTAKEDSDETPTCLSILAPRGGISSLKRFC